MLEEIPIVMDKSLSAVPHPLCLKLCEEREGESAHTEVVLKNNSTWYINHQLYLGRLWGSFPS